MSRRFSVETVFSAVDRFSRPLSRMQKSVGQATRRMALGFKRVNRAIASGIALTRSFVTSIALVGATMAAIAVPIFSTLATFEHSVVSAAAKFPGAIRRGTDEFKKLEDVARRVGATTEFTASQAAEGLNFLALAGFKADQAIAALPGLVDLATAAQIDLATASTIAADSLGAFNLKSDDSAQLARNLTRVSDVLAKTTVSANTDMLMLYETLKNAGPNVAAAGGDIESFAGIAGILANSSIKASEAGTQIKNMFVRMSAPTTQAARLLKRLGVRTKDSNGDLRDMVDIFADLEQGLRGYGSADKLAILSELFGLRAITAANAILGKGADALRRYRKEIRGADGASKQMAATMRDDLLGRWHNLLSAFESVRITIGKMKQSGLESWLERITSGLRELDKVLTGGTPELDKRREALFKQLKLWGNIIAAVVGLIVVLKVLAGVLTLVNLITMANPIVLGVMAAIAAVGLLIFYWDEFMDLVRGAPTWLLIVLGPLALIAKAIQLINDNWESWVKKVKEFQANFSIGATAFANPIETIKFLATGKAEGDLLQALQPQRQQVSPAQRQAAATASVNGAIVIKDQTGRAAVEQQPDVAGLSLRVLNTGAF